VNDPKKNRRVSITSDALPIIGEPNTPAVSRFDLNAAIDRLKGRKNILIFMHDNPDPDSLAAAMGLGRLLEHELAAKTTLAVSGIVGRAENRAMVEVLEIPIQTLHNLNTDDFDCLAIVDSQPRTGNNSLPDNRDPDIVVDHHPARTGVRSTWFDVRDDFGATSTIVLQYLHERNIPIDTRLATAFFYALRTETRDLGREATEAERAAYVFLVSHINHDWLDRICHPKVPRQHFEALDRAMRSARVHGNLVAVNLDELSYPDLVAEIADLLLRFEGARFTLVGGRYQGKAYVSLRTDVDFKKAGATMRAVIGTDGTAGGHGTMAGGRLRNPIDTPEAMHTAFANLVVRLQQTLGLPQSAGVNLLDS